MEQLIVMKKAELHDDAHELQNQESTSMWLLDTDSYLKLIESQISWKKIFLKKKKHKH